ncbi:SRPBCC family protein [Undibacterium terreum]|uniref:Activator of HSP90 ATPase n=1 Tax=Undibacterium terreum TaxID=1224302 RepID=A0A916XRU8_9BURK|nr:SRPBCC family protein [Undibacterium terreum]GGC98800.1 activator of HSP90 ATPase [Undibacterium terreum]
MDTEKFVYVTYIAATPEKVWQALIEGEITRQYWAHENVPEAGWKPGTKWQHVAANEQRTVKVIGEVLEHIPQKRLVLSWVGPSNFADKTRHTRVAMDIETVGDMVRLTITHDQLNPETAAAISKGWPRVISSLKSFLETGKPLDVFA